MKKHKKAVIYCRVASTPILRPTDAMMPQIEECRRKLKEDGYEETVCIEAWEKSGFDVESPQLRQLIELARAGKIDAVYIHDWTRLTRDIFFYEVLREYLEQYQVKVVTCVGYGDGAKYLVESFHEGWIRQAQKHYKNLLKK